MQKTSVIVLKVLKSDNILAFQMSLLIFPPFSTAKSLHGCFQTHNYSHRKKHIDKKKRKKTQDTVVSIDIYRMGQGTDHLKLQLITPLYRGIWRKRERRHASNSYLPKQMIETRKVNINQEQTMKLLFNYDFKSKQNESEYECWPQLLQPLINSN